MPKMSKGKTSSSVSPNKTASGRSRTKSGGRQQQTSSTVTDTSSRSRGRSPSPSRGRPPNTSTKKPRSRSPARSKKTTTNDEYIETNSSTRKRTQTKPTEYEPTPDSLVRLRKRPEPATSTPNGSTSNYFTNLGHKIADEARHLRSSDIPKIKTAIFDNIKLTPAITAAKEKKELVKAKLIDDRNVVKKWMKKSWYEIRKLAKKCYSRLPNWKYLLAIFLTLLIVFASGYIYRYHRETVRGYTTRGYQKFIEIYQWNDKDGGGGRIKTTEYTTNKDGGKMKEQKMD